MQRALPSAPFIIMQSSDNTGIQPTFTTLYADKRDEPKLEGTCISPCTAPHDPIYRSYASPVYIVHSFVLT